MDERFREAAELLAEATTCDLLRSLLRHLDAAVAVGALVQRIDHVGFMTIEGTDVAGAAQAAGFRSRHRSFPSTILARRLGALSDADIRPTTIFKADDDAGRTIEVAIPHGVPESMVQGWIDGGIGSHVAFRLAAPFRFPEVRRLLEAEGYSMPAFTSGEPLTNPVEGITAMFFERRPEQPLGIEFCSYERMAGIVGLERGEDDARALGVGFGEPTEAGEL